MARVQQSTTPWRTVLRATLAGALPGALAYFGLFALCLAAHSRPEYLGVEDDALAGKVVSLFHDELVAHQLGLLASYLGIGALVGLATFGYVELVRRVARWPYHRWRHLFWTALGILVVHSWFVVRSAARHPAVYEPQVHNSLFLGVLFWLAVDVLPRWLVDLLGVAAALSTATLALVLVARRAGLRPSRAAAPAGVLGVAALALVFTHPAAVAPSARPNILILAVDSLRADMLDHDPPVTPNIDALARGGVRFDNAYSVMPRTFPSWASILTGLYPHHHGVRHMFPPPTGGPHLDGALPKVLGRAGYRTAVISDFAGDPFTRGDFGFQHTDAPEFTLRSNVRLGSLKVQMHLLPYLIDVFGGAGTPELQAFERLGEPRWLTDKALDWIASPDPRPFFLVVFYSAGHFPFASSAPFYERYVDPGYRGRSRFHKAVVGQPLEGPARALEEDHIRGLYEGAIASSDAAIGDLLDALDERGRLSDTIVVVTADHGEILYERDLGVGHGDHLYGRNTLHVPLVFSWRGMDNAGAHIPTPTPLIDVAPTLLARVGLVPPPHIDGVDQSAVITGERAPEKRPIFAETGLVFFPPETHRVDDRIQFARAFSAFKVDPGTWAIYLDPAFEDTAIMAKQRAFIDGDWKLVYVPTRDGVRWELYDEARDPADQDNLVAAEPERLRAMQDALTAWMLQDPGVVRLGDFVVPRSPLDPSVGEAGP